MCIRDSNLRIKYDDIIPSFDDRNYDLDYDDSVDLMDDLNRSNVAQDLVSYSEKEKNLYADLLFNKIKNTLTHKGIVDFINKSKDTMDELQYDTLIKLFPEWDGSLDDLESLARNL